MKETIAKHNKNRYELKHALAHNLQLGSDLK